MTNYMRRGRPALLSVYTSDTEPRWQSIADHDHRLEKLVRDTLAAQNHDRIRKIVHQLCHDYTYAVHQPYARNGGLIGLAAASIALGPVRHSSAMSPHATLIQSA